MLNALDMGWRREGGTIVARSYGDSTCCAAFTEAKNNENFGGIIRSSSAR
jgi:hypothetical protein